MRIDHKNARRSPRPKVAQIVLHERIVVGGSNGLAVLVDKLAPKSGHIIR